MKNARNVKGTNISVLDDYSKKSAGNEEAIVDDCEGIIKTQGKRIFTVRQAGCK